MSDTKNRAASGKRRAARVIKVAPVTLAIRAALAVSATTLALARVARAISPIPPSPPRHSTPGVDRLAHHPACRRPDDGQCRALAEQRLGRAGCRSHHSAGIATSGGRRCRSEAESLGAVQDLVVVPYTDARSRRRFRSRRLKCAVHLRAASTLYSGSRQLRRAYVDDRLCGLRLRLQRPFHGFTSNGDISATGATPGRPGSSWKPTRMPATCATAVPAAITTNASGDYGQAWGIYVAAVDDVHVYNDGVDRRDCVRLVRHGHRTVRLFADQHGKRRQRRHDLRRRQRRLRTGAWRIRSCLRRRHRHQFRSDPRQRLWVRRHRHRNVGLFGQRECKRQVTPDTCLPAHLATPPASAVSPRPATSTWSTTPPA